MTNTDWTQLVLNDRSERRLGRSKYAELVGLTPTKIHNIESGRAPKPDEREKLEAFFSGRPIPTVPAPAPAPAPSAPAPTPMSQSTPAAVVIDDEEDEDDFALVTEGDQLVLTATASNGTVTGVTSNGMDWTPVLNGAEPELKEVPNTWELPARYEFKLPGYHVSNSELSTFKRCRRKWWLAYYRELRLKAQQVVGPRAIGTRLHIALSAYYGSGHANPREVLEATIAHDRGIVAEGTDVEALETLESEADLARAMLEGYLEWIRETGADEGIEVVGDETVVEVPFTDDVTLVGKLDLRIIRKFDQARLFLDHKTVGDLKSPTRTLHLDEQMLHYHLLEFLEYLQQGMDSTEAEQVQSAGGLYNMIRKVKRTAQAKPPFFARLEVRHNIHELRSYYLRVYGEMEKILELQRRLDAGDDPRMVAYPTPRRDCSWDCDFLPVCPLFDDGSDAESLLNEYYEEHDPHDHYAPYGEREIERQEV